MEKVLLTIENGVAWLTINRAEKRNAIDYDVIELLSEKLNIVETSDDAKILVITGKGSEAFCSGGDLSVFHSIYTKVEAEKMLHKMAMNLQRLFFFSKPTIAFLNGTAVGGGCEIASSCDFRIAEKNVKLGFIQGKLGITTGWGGSTFLLERIDPGQALQKLMGAETFDVNEAITIGFVNKMYNREQFENWLTGFTRQPLGVILAYKKRFLDRYDKQQIMNWVLREIDDCSSLWEMPEHHEAVERFRNK